MNAINAEHRNPKVFPDFELPTSITATTSVAEACKGAKMILCCLPAQLTPDFLAQHKDAIDLDAILVVTSKGLYLKTKQLLSIPILEALERDQPLAFLSGRMCEAILLMTPHASLTLSFFVNIRQALRLHWN